MLDVTELLDGSVVLLTLNRPASLNALNGSLLDALDAALDAVERNDQVRGLILTGEGRAVCAGADLKEQLDDPSQRVQRMHELAFRLRDFAKISVAAIDGLALGGGLELAMACTFRVAGTKAVMGLPEIRMNLVPGFGGTQLLPRLVGQSSALEMLLSGEPVDAAKAFSIGLVNSIAGEDEGAVAAAQRLVERCAAYGLDAQRAARAAVEQGLRLPLEEGLAIERKLVAQIGKSAAGRAGIQNFRAGGRH